MATKIVYNYAAIKSTADTLRNIAQKYADAATTYNTAITNAFSASSGASVTKFTTFETSVYKFMSQDVPEMVNNIAAALEGNAQSMADTDEEIAKNIPDSL